MAKAGETTPEERRSPPSTAVVSDLTRLRAGAGISTFKVRDQAVTLGQLRATADQLLLANLDPDDWHIAAHAMVRCTIERRIVNTDRHVCLLQTLNYDGDGSETLSARRADLQVGRFDGMSNKALAKLERDAYQELADCLVEQQNSPCRDASNQGPVAARAGQSITALVRVEFLSDLEADLLAAGDGDVARELIRRIIIEPRAWARSLLADRLLESADAPDEVRSSLTAGWLDLIGSLAAVEPWEPSESLSAEFLSRWLDLRRVPLDRGSLVRAEESRLDLDDGALGQTRTVPLTPDADRRFMSSSLGGSSMVVFVPTPEYFRRLHLSVAHLAEGLREVAGSKDWEGLTGRRRGGL